MGIAPYKYFTYDGESSRDYDVYLTGDGVFNAPERAVEMVEIPGRNGNYALDQGKFNNISVTYTAGIVDYSESDFADKVSAVRNWLCSKVGYKRLSDDYNPNEYRMAVYKSGVNIEHEDLRTGTFEITFDCKPQRWLTSGETAVTVGNGGILKNPTPFESEPLLAVDGYGTIGFNGHEVEIENVTIGNIQIASKKQYSSGWGSGTQVRTQSLSMDSLNNGDNFTVNSSRLDIIHTGKINTSGTTITSVTNGTATSELRVSHFTISVFPDDVTFSKGTSSSFVVTLLYHLNYSGGGTYSDDITVTLTIGYDGNDTLTYTCVGTPIPTTSGTPIKNTFTVIMPDIFGDSTKSVITDTVYIDCDIGECWTIQSGNIVSLNSVISLGSDLPKLSSGTNTFTYDNTVTELNVTPRWWKV